MPYYKNTNNELYFLDSSEFEHLIPSDCVQITDKEAHDIQSEQEANRPVVIPNISMRQARLFLLAEGLLDDIENAMSTPEHKIWWDYSTIVERNNQLVDEVLKLLGKTDEEIDQMFINASQL